MSALLALEDTTLAVYNIERYRQTRSDILESCPGQSDSYVDNLQGPGKRWWIFSQGDKKRKHKMPDTPDFLLKREQGVACFYRINKQLCNFLSQTINKIEIAKKYELYTF